MGLKFMSSLLGILILTSLVINVYGLNPSRDAIFRGPENLVSRENDYQLSAQKASDLIRQNQDTNLIILDLQSPQQRQKNGFLDKAIFFIDVLENQDLDQKIQSLDSQKIYLLYSASNSDSLEIARKIRNIHSTKVYTLTGGILAWQYAGFSLNFYDQTDTR